MAGMNEGRSINAVQTELDMVFDVAYDAVVGPQMATVSDALVFNQSSTDRRYVKAEVFKGPGLFSETSESDALPQEDAFLDDNKTYKIRNWKQQINVPIEYYEDDIHDTVMRMTRQLGQAARVTQEITGFGVWADAMDGNTYTTAEGLSLVNDSHTTLSGDTVDNKITDILSPSGLDTAMTKLTKQINQAGIQMGMPASVLLVDSSQFKEACEVVESKHIPDSADNAINVYSSKYNLYVKQSPYIGGTSNSNYWFLLSPNHTIYRWVRKPLETRVISWEYSDNDEYVYKARYREQYGIGTYEGVVGSTGAGA